MPLDMSWYVERVQLEAIGLRDGEIGATESAETQFKKLNFLTDDHIRRIRSR
jgi:hypothetical protein